MYTYKTNSKSSEKWCQGHGRRPKVTSPKVTVDERTLSKSVDRVGFPAISRWCRISSISANL